MSNSTPVRCRTIENVDLPAPATKLIITQHLKASRDSPYWAWIIVGAFYDCNNNVLWSTEVFTGRLEVDSDSDEETVDSESESESGSSVAASDTEDTSSDIYPSYQRPVNPFNYYQNEVSQPQQSYPHWYQSSPYSVPPQTWDPSRQGPVPGYWNASFDPNLRRWVHTWQPLC
ncbi:hypothetical protein FAVG1_06722 [Fusarium avenaceum]|nr:hypothetical protein FAVG1_06722 [Fusarium avenaceum]